MRIVSGTDLVMQQGRVIFKLWCLAMLCINPIAIVVVVGEGTRVTKANVPNNAQVKNKTRTHTFGEIRSKILVQFVKMGFGDDNGVQRRVIGALVRRAPRLECAVLIVGNPRISRRRW